MTDDAYDRAQLQKAAELVFANHLRDYDVADAKIRVFKGRRVVARYPCGFVLEYSDGDPASRSFRISRIIARPAEQS